MTIAQLCPSEYAQPRPIDGVYSALVFRSHAEFQYLGRKVIAKAAPDSMGANGCFGRVVVKGFSADISWDGSGSCEESAQSRGHERALSYQSALVATLVPFFDQAHPFLEAWEFRSRTKSIDLEFGYHEKYLAVLDGDIQFAVKDAPCTIKAIEGQSLKCLVVFDEATIFLATRYGPGTHHKLVQAAVGELNRVLSPE